MAQEKPAPEPGTDAPDDEPTEAERRTEPAPTTPPPEPPGDSRWYPL